MIDSDIPISYEDVYLLNTFHAFSTQDIDWGSLDIWTCTGSCNNDPIDATVNRIDGAYMEEFCWRQPSPSLNQSPGHEMGD